MVGFVMALLFDVGEVADQQLRVDVEVGVQQKGEGVRVGGLEGGD